jgi:hypothetical protein
MRTNPTEAETQKAILELLAAHNIFAGRLNTGAGFVGGRPIQHHSFGKGCADILAFPVIYSDFEPRVQIVPFWIEVKAPGKKQSPEQVSFQRHVESLDHSYLLVDNVDQVLKWIEAIEP